MIVIRIQGKLWAMTPNQRLDRNISCWEGELSMESITRFGPVNYDKSSNTIQQNDSWRNQNELAKELSIAKEEEIRNVHQIYGTIPSLDFELIKERQEMTQQAIKELSIPVQPRKYLDGTSAKRVLIY